MPRRPTGAEQHCFWSARGAFRLILDRDSIIAEKGEGGEALEEQLEIQRGARQEDRRC